MEAYDKGKVDDKTGFVVGGEEFDDEYNLCILPPNNGQQLGRLHLKRRKSQIHGTKARRCSKCSKIEYTR